MQRALTSKLPLSITRGFTLIELLVVIAIIGILASVVLASLSDARASARDAARLSEVKQLQTALELYANANNNNYPCIRESATCLTTNSNAVLRRGTMSASDISVTRGTNFRSDIGSYLDLGPLQDTTINIPTTLQITVNTDQSGYKIITRLERNGGQWCKFESNSDSNVWNNPDQFPSC